ncbi:MAG: serine/threonine protein kinase [Myxococcales bacterium]|nr:serine/threonine protein kinase [Myxococcales bacterium]
MGLLSRLGSSLRLDAALEAAFARETAELNRRRLRMLSPIMVTLHVLHVAFFYIRDASRAALSVDVQRWRDALTVAHSVMIPLAVTLLVLSYRKTDQRIFAWLAPITAILYLQHGALVAGIDQIVAANVSVYIGYCFGIAVVLALTPPVIVVGYTASAATLVAALWIFQRSPSARLSHLPTCTTLTVVSIAFAWLMYNSRRKELWQRSTIDRQRDELTALNDNLSHRVQEQVAEIMTRAAEVDRLNVQLSAQVRARSSELSLALGKLASQRNADGSLPLGLVLANRFAVAERLGRGGMGVVYAGVDRSTGARVAIKVIQASSSDQLDSMRRFIREVGVAATVAHPAVVRMLHVDVSDDGLLFQVQELVAGETLTGHAGRPWPPAEAARLAAVLCEALAAAHLKGVVHRDVKPDNMMLTVQTPGLKLLDFGIAKLGDALSQASEHTAVRMVIGTPGYMAPEQAGGRSDVTDRADVYAVGVILFQLLSGRLPVDNENAAAVAGAEPGLPPELMALIGRCLEEVAAARPSAHEVAAELARFADRAAAPSLETLARNALMDPTTRSALEVQLTTPNRRGSVA